MSLTTSFFGGAPDGFGIAGFVFVSFRLVDALGAAGVVGPAPAGMAAVVAEPPPPPPPPTAIAATPSTAGSGMGVFREGQPGEPLLRALRRRPPLAAASSRRSRSGGRGSARSMPL